MSVTEGEEAFSSSGRAATHPYGVLYHGDYQNPADGMSVAIRAHARALADAGIPVLLRPISNMVATKTGILEPLHTAELDPAVRAQVGDLMQGDISSTTIKIRHLIPHSLSQISGVLMKGAVGPLDRPDVIMGAREAIYKSSILFSVWERDRISPELARELSRVRENWVPCEQNAEMLRKMGVKNVRVVPHPYSPSDDLCLLPTRPLVQGRRFYSIGKWEPRKNYPALIEGFLRAFTPQDTDVHLTIKTSGRWQGFGSYEEERDRILALPEISASWDRASYDRFVTIVDKTLKRGNILKLHYENNIYVSPSCGEGFGVPAFEAKVAGNAMVYVPWGGPADFASPSDVGIEYSMQPVPATYRWEKGALWAYASPEQVCSALQAAKAPERWEKIDERFSAPSVGKQMREAVLDILKGSPAGNYLQELG